jgi:hypothetical protein
LRACSELANQAAAARTLTTVHQVAVPVNTRMPERHSRIAGKIGWFSILWFLLPPNASISVEIVSV